MSALFRAREVDFDRLYRRHAPTVYRYAYAVLGKQADAEDITQQTFLNAYRAVSQGTKPRKLENWLIRIAHNEIRRHFRLNGKAVEVEFDDELAKPAPEHADPSLAEVLRALWQLPPIQRSALVMREFEGRSYAEIAETLEITQSALEALIFRARRGLAEQLEGALTCAEAEESVSRRLDRRLPRREARRLKAHLGECGRCVRFAELQKRQRSVLKGLSVMPIPASLFLFRGEHAAAAAGLGGATAAGAGGIGLGSGLLAKAAAVTAAASVAGGVGYQAATGPGTAASPERQAARPAAIVPASKEEATRVRAVAAPRQTRRSTPPVRKRSVHPRRKAEKAKPRTTKPLKEEKERGRDDVLRGKPAFVVKTRPTKPARVKQPSTHGTRTRRRGATAPGRLRRAQPKPKPQRAGPKIEKAKPPRPVDPLTPTPEEPPAKKQRT